MIDIEKKTFYSVHSSVRGSVWNCVGGGIEVGLMRCLNNYKY
jgi:hypothetical protein